MWILWVAQSVNLVLVLCHARRRSTQLWQRWPLSFLRSVNVPFVPLAHSVKQAWVSDFIVYAVCPQRPALDAVRASLKLLASSASRLQVECRKAAPSEPSASAVDYQLLTQQVIQCAYDIAKAAKQLVTITTREKKQWPSSGLDGCRDTLQKTGHTSGGGRNCKKIVGCWRWERNKWWKRKDMNVGHDDGHFMSDETSKNHMWEKRMEVKGSYMQVAPPTQRGNLMGDTYWSGLNHLTTSLNLLL